MLTYGTPIKKTCGCYAHDTRQKTATFQCHFIYGLKDLTDQCDPAEGRLKVGTEDGYISTELAFMQHLHKTIKTIKSDISHQRNYYLLSSATSLV
jgi:hypothetical protein